MPVQINYRFILFLSPKIMLYPILERKYKCTLWSFPSKLSLSFFHFRWINFTHEYYLFFRATSIRLTKVTTHNCGFSIHSQTNLMGIDSILCINCRFVWKKIWNLKNFEGSAVHWPTAFHLIKTQRRYRNDEDERYIFTDKHTNKRYK